MPDLFERIGTFDIVPRASGYVAVDCCTFNRWPASAAFETQDMARLYAERAHAFKIGQTMTGPDDAWAARMGIRVAVAPR